MNILLWLGPIFNEPLDLVPIKGQQQEGVMMLCYLYPGDLNMVISFSATGVIQSSVTVEMDDDYVFYSNSIVTIPNAPCKCQSIE